MRSRAVFLPRACCFPAARAEPACTASSVRRSRSASLPAVVWMSSCWVTSCCAVTMPRPPLARPAGRHSRRGDRIEDRATPRRCPATPAAPKARFALIAPFVTSPVTTWMTPTGTALIASGIATLIAFRTTLFGRVAGDRRADGPDADGHRPGARAADRPGTRVTDQPGTRVVDRPSIRVADLPGIRVADELGTR